MSNDFDLTGKICIVTGGGRGIGRGMAEGITRNGGTVVLAGRTQATLDETAAALGNGAWGHATDVAKETDVVALRDAVIAKHGKIDVLVNNAGVDPIFKHIERTSLEEWQHIIDINLTGLFLCCKYLGGAIGKGGSVINVSSLAGHVGLVRSVPYCASKGGAELLTKALAIDWAERGVRVNALAPGWVDTEMCTEPFAGDGKARIASGIPLGRIASVDDIAGPIVFLCSSLARHITGEILNVNGGSVLCG